MPTAHTVTSIYNGALDLVTSHPVTLSDNRVEVRWLNRNFTHYVQASLRQDLWNFATKLHELDKRVDEPAFRWSYGYDLPNGWLRVIPPRTGGDRRGRPIPYEVKSGILLSNHDVPMYVELIMDRQDPGEWDPLFANLIIARLGHGMAHALTHKASYVQLCKLAVDEAYDTAAMVNAFESPSEETEQFDIIRARGMPS